jgi:hypothetical protein
LVTLIGAEYQCLSRTYQYREASNLFVAVSLSRGTVSAWQDDFGPERTAKGENEVNPTRNQVSTDGGEAPRWITDDELAFVASDGTMMTVRIDGRDGALEGQRPEALFPTRVGGTQTFNQQYDVSSDGRFLINGYQDDAIPSPITLLLNWRP